MKMDDLRHSLEELFSDFEPPAAEAEPVPEPPSEEEAVPGPEPAPPAEPSAEEGVRREAEETVPPPEPIPAEPAVPSVHEGRPLIAARVTRVRDRLVGSVLIVFALLVVATVLIFSSLTQMKQIAAALHEDSLRMETALDVYRAAMTLLDVLRDEATTQELTRFTERTEAALEALDQELDRLTVAIGALPPEDPLRTALIDFEGDVLSPRVLAIAVRESAQEGDWERVLTYSERDLIAFHRDRIARSLDEVRAVMAEREANYLTAFGAARQTVQVVPIVWGALIALALTATTVATVRSIAGPVERLTEATARLAAGHLEERVEIEREDEFGRLADAFNEMARELQAYTTELEERVAERTQALQEANAALQRRAILLQASAEVGRAITSILDVDELLRRTVDLIRDRFGFYHAGIFLLDEKGEWAVLREATGEAGEQMKARGHRLRVEETSMVGWTALHRRPRIALDVGEDAVHFDNPLLPYTRSEVTLPLMVGNRLLGVLDVQSTEEAAFDEDDVRTLQSMADQIAVALENARRISDEALLLEATSPMYRASRRLTTATTLEEVSEVIIGAVAESGADGCIIALFEPWGASEPAWVHFIVSWREHGETPVTAGTRLPVSAARLRMEITQRLWSVSDVERPSLLTADEVAFFREAGVRAVANVPLRIGERPMGFVIAYRSKAGPFTEAALRLYEALIDQASLALERARLLEATREQAEDEAMLRALGDRIARSIDMGTVLRNAAEGLSEALRATGVYIELGPGTGDGRGSGER